MHVRTILLLVFVLLLLGWAAGVLLNAGGPSIHLLLIAAVGVLIVRILKDRPRRGDA